MKILMLHRQRSSVSYYRTFLPAQALRKQRHDITVLDDYYPKSLGPDPQKWIEDNTNTMTV